MDPLTFAYLVVALSPRIDRNFVQAENAGGYIERAAEFALRQRPHMRVFRGVVGAIDGLLVKIRCPG